MVDGPVQYTKGNRNGPDPFSAWHNLQAVLGQQDVNNPNSSVAMGTQGQAPALRTVPTVAITAKDLGAALSDPIGDPKSWGEFQGNVDDPTYPIRTMAQIRATGQPSPTLDASNPLDISRLGLTNDPFQNNPAAQEIGKMLTQGGPFAGALASGGLRNMFPSEPNGMPIDSSIPTNTPAYRRQAAPVQQPTRGLGAIGNPAVYSQPTKPAITTYQAALQQAAQQHNTTPEAIHQQLMAQQSPDQRGQAALNAAGMGPGQGGSSGGANGVGSW